MSKSKYKPKEALWHSDELIKFKTRADIEKYVKKANPYRTSSGSAIKGVVAEVVNYVTFMAVGSGGTVTSEDVDNYFRERIPVEYQQSGEYISEMVKRYQKEYGLPIKKVTQEELAYIRSELAVSHSREKFRKLYIDKSVARGRNGELKTAFKGADVTENADGSIMVNVVLDNERYGGLIGSWYGKSKTLRIKDQFTPEGLRKILAGNVGVNEKLIDFLSKHGKEFLVIDGKHITERAYNRKIVDVSAQINAMVAQVYNPIIVGLSGEHLTVEDVDTALFDKLDGRFGEWGGGNNTRDRLSRLFTQLKGKLTSHTTFRMYALVVQAILQNIDNLSDEQVESAVNKIFDNNWMPDDIDNLYIPQHLSGWISDVLGAFGLDDMVIGALQSTAFVEEGDSSTYEDIAYRKSHKAMSKMEVEGFSKDIIEQFGITLEREYKIGGV